MFPEISSGRKVQSAGCVVVFVVFSSFSGGEEKTKKTKKQTNLTTKDWSPDYNTKNIMETILKVLDFRDHTYEDLCAKSLRALRDQAKLELLRLKSTTRRKEDVVLYMLKALCS